MARLARSALLLAALVAQAAGAAPALELRGSWEQGGLIRGKAAPASKVWFNGQALPLTADGWFVLALDRDAPALAELQVQESGAAAAEVLRYPVAQRSYAVQRIDGLPPDKVEPPPQVRERIAREQALLSAARAIVSTETGFLQDFIWPATGRVSGVYGSQRILNGVPKQPHYGVDVAIPTGTPLRAPADGVVILAERDLYFTGGTLMLDHGHGVSSIMVHLSAMKVKNGDRVHQGEIVALSGMTGRATGPHLHWGVGWLKARVDPQRLVPPMVPPIPATKNGKP